MIAGGKVGKVRKRSSFVQTELQERDFGKATWNYRGGRANRIGMRFSGYPPPGSSSVRRIRSNAAAHVVLQSGAEWVSVANQSWSIGPG
jgi:hypothetical protein